LKDVFVKTDEKTTLVQAKDLFTAMTSVKTETLKRDVHMVRVNVFEDLTADT
jgi:hypothetical protein